MTEMGKIYIFTYSFNDCTIDRNQPEITELLLQKGALVNALNKGGCSTLHVAVNKQHVKCVQVLLKHKADVNIQVCFHFYFHFCNMQPL